MAVGEGKTRYLILLNNSLKLVDLICNKYMTKIISNAYDKIFFVLFLKTNWYYADYTIRNVVVIIGVDPSSTLGDDLVTHQLRTLVQRGGVSEGHVSPLEGWKKLCFRTGIAQYGENFKHKFWTDDE